MALKSDVDRDGAILPNDTIASVAPTLMDLCGVAPPAVCQATPLARILDAGRTALRGGAVQRCLVYAPDAMGLQLLQSVPYLFDEIRREAPLEVRLRSMLPSKTPVCFASMFTGAPPKAHGIRQYERPVLRCDTLFDAFLRAAKRIAIVAVAGSSIDMIFRERVIDYFSEDYDPEVTETTLSLLRLDHHDLILAYHQEYDDALHETNPFTPRASKAAQNHARAFQIMAAAANSAWKHHHRAILFAPDHGARVDPVTGRGTHGGDSPDEMDVAHFWGFHRGSRPGRRASGDVEDHAII